MARKLFCEISPLTYRISVQKGIILKDLSDLFRGEQYARRMQSEPLPYIVKSHVSLIERQLAGVNPQLQKNKATNLALAARGIHGLVIAPGETFSFWRAVGHPSEKDGYLPGLTLSTRKGLGSAIGGGLCQMANMVHWLVLHSPLTVTELHHHSDAMFPDERRRVPFGTGTSVFYNRLDYRFRNTTDQPVQLLVWIEDGYLCGELRSLRSFGRRYRMTEEDHYFSREGGDYYRNSKVYRLVSDEKTGKEIAKELVLVNHSKVLYDPALIPKEQLRD